MGSSTWTGRVEDRTDTAMSTGGPGPKTGSDPDVWANQVSGLAKHMGKDDDPDWDETEQSEHPGALPAMKNQNLEEDPSRFAEDATNEAKLEFDIITQETVWKMRA